MAQLRFRQWLSDANRFHYWGFLEDGFNGPITELHTSNIPPSEQFTGLLDKNGKEIFEGDWVIGEEFSKWKERGLVLWYRNWCGFGVDWDYMSNMPLVDNRRFGEQDNKLEVIGNVHEHPHLLPPQ